MSIAVAIALAACDAESPPDQAASADSAALAAPGQAQWSSPVSLPLVPAGAALLPDGRLLFWSSAGRFGGSGGGSGQTMTASFDPASGAIEEHVVTRNAHDMAGGAAVRLDDGRLMISGGIDPRKTSLFDPVGEAWIAAAPLHVGRGRNAGTLLPDGAVLTIGGSWAGDSGIRRVAERWSREEGWRMLTGIPVDALATADSSGAGRADNKLWLFSTGTGRVLQAGPGAAMHWIDPRGDGSIASAGPRGDDADAMNGAVAMFDADKILKTGGAPDDEGSPATVSSYLIDVDAGAKVRKLPPMNFARAFHNSVVLPNGQVVLIGGQSVPLAGSDNRAVLEPELWDPQTETFTQLPPIAVPRASGSVALLLPDGRVLSAGGGLCGDGCPANHSDLQIMTPPFLLNLDGTPAARPVLEEAPAQANLGTRIAVKGSPSIAAFSLLRMSAVTQGVNSDQRRIPLHFTTSGGGTYALDLPSRPGLVLPGLYMLFALDARGVPSIAKVIRIETRGLPRLDWPGPQAATVGAVERLDLMAASAHDDGNSFTATGLPPGLNIEPRSGLITGIPEKAGQFDTTVTASNGRGAVSTTFAWTVDAAGTGPTPGPVRYVKLEAVREISGAVWSSMAEFNLLDANRQAIDRSHWRASADSAESLVGNGAAANAIDGNPDTLWHTEYSQAPKPPPHSFIVDLGRGVSVGGFRYLPRRTGGTNGMIDDFRFYVSPDGVHWGEPVAQGHLADKSSLTAERTVLIATSGLVATPIVSTPAAQLSSKGQSVALQVEAIYPTAKALHFNATGLPPGLSIDSGTGRISGTLSESGDFKTTLQVDDGKGNSGTSRFVWTVQDTQSSTESVRYLKLEALSEINGGPWASMAELNLLDRQGNPLPRKAWSATADSSATSDIPANAIDGNPTSLWHTRWEGDVPKPPHWFVVDLGAPLELGGLRYLPRQDQSTNGTIARYRIFVSADGTHWGSPVAQGDFATLGDARAEKTVRWH